MASSAKELDQQLLPLIRSIVAQHQRNRKKWAWAWKKSELLGDGFSTLVVAKAEECDMKTASSALNAFAVMPVLLLQALINEKHRAFFVLFVVAIVGSWMYRKFRYYQAKLSHAENLLVLQELTERLSSDVLEQEKIYEEPPLFESWNRRLEKRAILWRLDAFLSRK